MNGFFNSAKRTKIETWVIFVIYLYINLNILLSLRPFSLSKAWHYIFGLVFSLFLVWLLYQLHKPNIKIFKVTSIILLLLGGLNIITGLLNLNALYPFFIIATIIYIDLGLFYWHRAKEV